MTDRDEPRLAELRDIDQVYQPAADSHLLAETVVERIAPDDRVLDAGTGSGYVGEYVLEETGASVVRGDLVSPFRPEAFDVVCFNPPYLPSAQEGVWDGWMEKAVTGGDDGRAVIERFIDDVGRVLRPDGEVYLLISTVTGPEEVQTAAANAGFDASVGAEESHSFEKLLVLRLVRTSE